MSEVTFPVRSVRIQGARAMAVIASMQDPARFPVMSVKDAADADKALADPENSHNCPLCNGYFSTELFKAHAQQCIDIHAPRERVWAPPGFSSNAVQAFPDKVSPRDSAYGPLG